MAGVVREIWRYPAKSMLGDRVERAELLGHGMVGDRMWAVRDGVRFTDLIVPEDPAAPWAKDGHVESGRVRVTLPAG